MVRSSRTCRPRILLLLEIRDIVTVVFPDVSAGRDLCSLSAASKVTTRLLRSQRRQLIPYRASQLRTQMVQLMRVVADLTEARATLQDTARRTWDDLQLTQRSSATLSRVHVRTQQAITQAIADARANRHLAAEEDASIRARLRSAVADMRRRMERDAALVAYSCQRITVLQRASVEDAERLQRNEEVLAVRKSQLGRVLRKHALCIRLAGCYA